MKRKTFFYKRQFKRVYFPFFNSIDNFFLYLNTSGQLYFRRSLFNDEVDFFCKKDVKSLGHEWNWEEFYLNKTQKDFN